MKKSWQDLHGLIFKHGLTEFEGSGRLSRFTTLKLATKTRQRLPFKLGHTVRGVSPSAWQLDPFFNALMNEFGDLDLERFSTYMHADLKLESELSVGDRNPFIEEAFHDLPLWCSVWPWSAESVEFMSANYIQLVEENRCAQLGGVQSREPIVDRRVDFVESHARQFDRLFTAIKSNGFSTQGRLPKVNILIGEHDWRWIMTGQGNHRFYLLWLMNYDSFPCEIENVIFRDRLAMLPNVRNGNYSISGAEALFDSFFEESCGVCIRGII